jgi:iron-sulfur cluster insertion protein
LGRLLAARRSRSAALHGGTGRPSYTVTPDTENLFMISLTSRAQEKVKEIQNAEGLHGQGLRVRVIGGGCSGFSYDLFFDDEYNDTVDESFEANGIPLYVDMMSHTYLDGTEIDYVEGLYGAGFKFINPTAKSTCGCGSSFSV